MNQMSEVTGSYTLSLVFLSLLMAMISSYTSLDLSYNVTLSSGWRRSAWLLSGAVAMGIGIWSMHFVAMLAFHLPKPVTYDLYLLSVSVFIAIVGSLVGLFIAGTHDKKISKLVFGGIFMGIGISGMHYMGMDAMRGVMIHYQSVYVLISILISIITSILALNILFQFRDQETPKRQNVRFRSSLLMGIAIFGMHFTGMKATKFTDYPYPPQYHLFTIDQTMLAIVISVFTILMQFLVLFSSSINQHLKAELEEQRAEKLKVLTDLTGAFAHEIRNPLQVNRGFLQLLHEQELPQSLKSYITICIDEIDRANSIIGDYLSFSKPEVQDIETIDVSAQIRKVMNLMSSYAMMYKVELNTKLERNTKIMANAQKFNQSLINIIKNGVEAMPDGGTLLIRCRNQNQYVVIDIIDQGVGMTNEQIKRLGSPFYSLKEKGTGLGLMVSYRIIHSYCGKINVISEKGRGTTFSILFPQVSS